MASRGLRNLKNLSVVVIRDKRKVYEGLCGCDIQVEVMSGIILIDYARSQGIACRCIKLQRSAYGLRV